MQEVEKQGAFYSDKAIALTDNRTFENLILYDAKDLTPYV